MRPVGGGVGDVQLGPSSDGHHPHPDAEESERDEQEPAQVGAGEGELALGVETPEQSM